MRNRLAGALALAFSICAVQAFAQSSYVVKDGNGAVLNMKAATIGGLITPEHIIVDPSSGVPANVTGAGALKTDASATVQPVSASALPLPTGAATAAAQASLLTAVGSPMQTSGGSVTANAGTNLNTSALALDTSVSGVLVAQGSTTSGQKGTLGQCAVTTSAPSYTTAQTSPQSCDTSGNTRVADAGVIAAITASALAPVNLQTFGTENIGDSGNVANATATATLSAVSGHTQYLVAAKCTATGATSASVVTGTITGLIGGVTLHFAFAFPAGVTLQAASYEFSPKMPIAASAQNTAISIVLPAGGSGNTNAACSIAGSYL